MACHPDIPCGGWFVAEVDGFVGFGGGGGGCSPEVLDYSVKY